MTVLCQREREKERERGKAQGLITIVTLVTNKLFVRDPVVFDNLKKNNMKMSLTKISYWMIILALEVSNFPKLEKHLC